MNGSPVISSIARINALLVDIKTINNALPMQLQQAGFEMSQPLGHEDEYTLGSLTTGIDGLAVQFLTITASRNQFIQRTAFQERREIEASLEQLSACLHQTRDSLQALAQTRYQVSNTCSLCYVTDDGHSHQLALRQAIDYIDQLKPYIRMLELVIAQERIHALSSVLETLLHRETTSSNLSQEEDNELTQEQHSALELSHYLIKQAL